MGAEGNMVRMGIGSDSRIGFSFINPGCGYGGSCFPKDVQALIKTSVKSGYEPRILRAVEEVNAAQKLIMADRVSTYYRDKLHGKTVAVWGLAFKPNTDDMRCSPAITIINELTARGAQVRAYDPKAMEEAKECYLRDNRSVVYCDDKYAALEGCNCLVIVTDWEECLHPDFGKIKEKLCDGVIFDGRNIYDAKELRDMDIRYYQIGVRSH